MAIKTKTLKKIALVVLLLGILMMISMPLLYADPRGLPTKRLQDAVSLKVPGTDLTIYEWACLENVEYTCGIIIRYGDLKPDLMGGGYSYPNYDSNLRVRTIR